MQDSHLQGSHRHERSQEYVNRRMADLQHIQTTYDLIAAAAAKVKGGARSSSDVRSACTHSEAHSASSGFWRTRTSASPALSKLMEDHELAQSKLCGTAQDTFSSTSPLYAYPGHRMESFSASFSTSPGSPQTPVTPLKHHSYSSSRQHSPSQYRQSTSHVSSVASDAHMQQFAQQNMHHACFHVPLVLEQSPPGPTAVSDTKYSYSSLQAGREGYYQNPDGWHSAGAEQQFFPGEPSGYTAHQVPNHTHSGNIQASTAGSGLPSSTPPLSDDQKLSVVQPYATSSDLDTLSHLRQGLIGNHATYTTPFGRKRLVYADWAASGRLLAFTEQFLTTQVAPWYANVHTDVGVCANHTSALLEEARECVAKSVHADRCDYSVLFLGSGMTAAVFKLAHLLGLTEPSRSPTGRPVVMYSIMEHHSNCLLWRELDVDTVVRGLEASTEAWPASLLSHFWHHVDVPPVQSWSFSCTCR